MICYACTQQDWHSMGDFSKEGEMLICKNCGNVCYKVDPAQEAKMKEYYRKHYRPEPTVLNLVTTNHKLQYVRVFLKDYMKSIEDKKILFGDIGCATGYLPAFFKSNGHNATGCEYTLTFRRFCEKWYGIPIPEELYRKRPYDMLSMYHVLEHMIKPDEKLIDYVGLLKEDGLFLISTPEWLNTLEEASGSQMISFEGLFPKPHINVFTAVSIQNLFRRAGLEIVKEDHVQYGQSYLLKRGAQQDIVKEDWMEIKEKLEKTKQAIDLYMMGKEEEAIAIWPKFPEAWMRLLLEKAMKDPGRQEGILQKGTEILKNNARWNSALGWWHFQNKRYDEAVKALKYIMEIKPNEQAAMILGACFLESGRNDLAFEIYNQAAAMNPMKWAECMNFMCKAASASPTWDERALQALAGEALKAAPAPEFKDPALEVVA